MAIYYENSWIKLPRDFINWQWYNNSNMVHLYLFLLLNANIKDEEYHGKTIHRGELYTSITSISFKTGLSVQTIKTCLNNLKMTKEVTFRKIGRGKITILLDFNRFQTTCLDEESYDWIRLYRKICFWKWYSSPKMLHLFVHFMIKAKVNLLPDGTAICQCKCTLRKLVFETGISLQSIRTCIEKLQSTGEILYEPSPTHSSTHIIICKYDTYQDIKTNPNRILTEYQPDSNRILTEYQPMSVTQKESNASNGCSDTYQDIKTNSNRILTEYQPDSNRILTEYQPDSNQILTAPKEYKNIKKERKKEYIIINNNDNNAHVRACEENENLETEKIAHELGNGQNERLCDESLFDLLRRDGLWLKAIMKRFKFSSLEEVNETLEDFQLDLVCRGKEGHRDLRDLKSHFCDWLKMQKSQDAPSSPTAVGGEMSLGDRFAEQKEKLKEKSSKSDEELRERILGMIDLVKQNPRSLCLGPLRAYHESGTLRELNIDWEP